MQTIRKLIAWLKAIFTRKPTTATYNIPYSPEPYTAPTFKATKAYADQRQRSPHNRRRKPSKAMRHLYQLS